MKVHTVVVPNTPSPRDGGHLRGVLIVGVEFTPPCWKRVKVNLGVTAVALVEPGVKSLYILPAQWKGGGSMGQTVL